MNEDSHTGANSAEESTHTGNGAPESERTGSGLTGRKFAVPEDLIKAGHDTDIPRADSPETLDQEL